MSKPTSFRLPTEIIDMLDTLAKKENKNRTKILMWLIQEGSKGFILNERNQYKWLDDPCIALAHLNEGWHCCIKAPIQKMLGDGSAYDAEKICTVCKKIKGIITENQLMKQQLKDGIEVEMPYCRGGGTVSEDQKTIRCPLRNNYPVSIQVCKTRNNGGYCHQFKYIKVQSQK